MLRENFKDALNEGSRLTCEFLTMNTDFHLKYPQVDTVNSTIFPINKDTKGKASCKLPVATYSEERQTLLNDESRKSKYRGSEIACRCARIRFQLVWTPDS